MKSLLVMMLFASTLLFATGTTDTTAVTIITDDKTNSELRNSADTTDIVDLSATTTNGLHVCNFKIKSLPDSKSGVLYMADGASKVEVNQNLTLDEANGLKFDPKEGFVGNSSFTYSGIDINGNEGTVATVTLPIIAEDSDNNDTTGGNGGSTSVTTDDKVNPEMLNSLPAVDILNLSGKDVNGVDVDKFVIKSLPDTQSGVLYMADATTAVTVNQNLTRDESDGLKFDPAEGYVGDAQFNYQAVDVNGNLGNAATVTIPVVSTLTPDNNGSAEDCVCEDYNESIPVLNNFGILLMMVITSLFGLFFARKEI